MGKKEGATTDEKTEATFWRLVSNRCRKRRGAQAVIFQLLKVTFHTGSRVSKDSGVELHQKATLGRSSYLTGAEGDVRHRQSLVTASESIRKRRWT